MKLPELKNKFKNKYVIRIVAGVLMVGMLGTSFQAYTVHAEKNESTESTEETSETEDDKDSTENEEALSNLLGDGLSVSQKTIGKDETVYVIADSTGKAKETIVSDHLINNDDEATLKDASTLKDIENVKGNETFTQSGNELTWQADGNDIYYQGTSTVETPITQQVTYYLDGKEITPEKLAGKSGKVTIHFDYTNNAKVGDVYVPFAAISGMILDDKFSDIEVTNGKVISDGNNNVVVGYALPGLKESLKLDDADMDEDVNIPDYFEVTADVENFSLDMTMTMAVNAANYVSTDGGLDLSSVDDLLTTLTDATTQLEDGSATLADGLDTLQSKMSEFSSGVTKLQSGIKTYTDGVSTLQSGVKSYTDGASQIAGGINTLSEKSGALADGVNTLNSGANALKDGVAALDAGLKTPLSDAERAAYEQQASKTAKDTVDAQFDDATNPKSYNNLKTYASGVYKDTMTSAESKEAAYQMLNAQDELKGAIKTSLQEQIAAAIGDASISATETGYGLTRAQAVQTIYNSTPTVQAGVAAQLGLPAAVTDYATLEANVVESKLRTMAGTMLSGVAANSADAVGESVAKAAKSGAEEAAEKAAASAVVIGIENAKTNVSTQINTKQASGDSLVSGSQKLAAGTQTLADSVPALTSGISTLTAGANALTANNDKLNSGVNQLAGNNDTLNSGMNTLATGTTALGDGVDKLTDGSHELADGIVQFNEEGIQKIVNAYNGDVKDLVDRVQSVLDAGEDYQSYTDIADGVNGSVKFIYKTAAVKTTEEE